MGGSRKKYEPPDKVNKYLFTLKLTQKSYIH